MGYSLQYMLSMLGYQAPVLLVCLGGMILAVVFLSRAKTPALLTLAGAGLWVVASLAQTAFQAWLIRARLDGGGSSFRQWMGPVGIASSLVHALALGLIVAAVFVGRPARPG